MGLCFKLGVIAKESTFFKIIFLFFEMESYSGAQAEMQWRYLSSLQPLPHEFKQFSCLNLLNSWDYRSAPPSTVNFVFLVKTGFHHVMLVSNSQPQVIHLPRPPKVLGLQAWAIALCQFFFQAKWCPMKKAASSTNGSNNWTSAFPQDNHGSSVCRVLYT